MVRTVLPVCCTETERKPGILLCWIGKGGKKSTSKESTAYMYTARIYVAIVAKQWRRTRLAFGHRSREEPSFPLVSSLSSPCEHYPAIDHTRAPQRNPWRNRKSVYTSSSGIPLSARHRHLLSSSSFWCTVGRSNTRRCLFPCVSLPAAYILWETAFFV